MAPHTHGTVQQSTRTYDLGGRAVTSITTAQTGNVATNNIKQVSIVINAMENLHGCRHQEGFGGFRHYKLSKF